MTFSECARRAAAVLEAAGHSLEDSRRDVAVLARSILGWDTARWLTDRDHSATPDFGEKLAALVGRRLSHEPVAYLIGEREFYGRAFHVSADVLIPRPETEGLVDIALTSMAERDVARHGAPIVVVDVGTGSGCVAITLALERRSAHLIATDISQGALQVATRNAISHGVDARIDFRRVSFTGGALGVIDVLVSNPPYVSERDRHTLAPDVRDFEPGAALFGGPDGLAVIRALVSDAARALRPGGWLLVETAHDQHGAVERMVREHGLQWMGGRTDLAGLPRIAMARRPSDSV